MLRPVKVATPALAATVVVPESVPAAGLVLMAIETLPLKLASVFPAASCAATLTAGAMAAPAVALPGCAVWVSRDGASATRRSADDSPLPPNDVQALARPDWSTARYCQ